MWAAFSILERIEWAATQLATPTACLCPLLSVSSNGSNGLRLPPFSAHLCRPRTFSILERIEWAATRGIAHAGVPIAPFSILERIEWAATWYRNRCWSGQHRFQYPRTDRMGCDSSLSTWPVKCSALSVSSNGSNGLRHLLVGSVQHTHGGFQYPRTDRMGCDTLTSAARVVKCSLFQYPRTDRMGCDKPEICTPRPRAQLSVSSNGSNGLRLTVCVLLCTSQTLSVSSNGSNGLRPYSDVWWATGDLSFSILERIEWAAPPTPTPTSTLVYGFQYPRTDRMGCDYCAWWPCDGSDTLSVSSNGSNGLRLQTMQGEDGRTSGFQYPRTDRMGCDSANDVTVSAPRHTFSILERIEWAATFLTSPSCLSPTTSFSILERIEWAATRRSEHTTPQLPRFQYPRTDRMGCDHSAYKSNDAPKISFSILERIEWAATSEKRPGHV